MKCHCQQFVLLNPEAEHEPGTASFDAVRQNSIVHTVKSCLHECDVPQDLLFDYTCSCWKFFPANYTMTLTLNAEAWRRLRAMIVCDVVLSPYDDTSKRLDSLVDDIDQLINFDESELI